MQIALKTITGRIREKDEDSVFAATASYAGQDSASERSVLALGDGMGGGGAGEVASGILVESVRKNVVPLMFDGSSLDDEKISARIHNAVSEANGKIREYANRAKIETMGTTAVIAFIEGDRITVANVGDSRLYIVNAKAIRQLTKDDSFVQMLYERGEITRDQMRKHPKKNLITKGVGLDEEIAASVTHHRLFRGDRVLLCCDGLWESMPDADIGTLAMEADINQAADRLVEDANSLDGTDNISLVLGAPALAVGEEDYSRAGTKVLPRPAAE